MKRMILAAVIVLLSFSQVESQQYMQLLDNETRDLLHEVLSGEMAKEYTINIARYHRIQGSRGYRQAAEYVLKKLRQGGLSESDAYIESYESNGRKQYQLWQSPSGWDMEKAEIRMIEPYNERIIGFPEVPMSLITYSNPGDVTAELVWVGSGTSDDDYTGKDVRGKFVLATGYGGEVHRHAVLKYGAEAVICYLDDYRAKEYPDMLAYTGMWPKTEELENVTFGFNLTNRQGEKLRGLLESGQKVVMRGWAKGIGLEPYFMDAVVAHIRGSEKPDEEVVFVGHLDHPAESANDNGSGCGAMIDMVLGMKELINSGRIERPKRSFRFLWIAEFFGMMAYVDKHTELVGPELGGGFLAAMNLDMVGEHLELIHTNMNFTRTPGSLPSVLNDVVENMARMVDRMNIRTPRGSLSRYNFRVTPYSGGSDHNIFIDRKIPAMMIGHGDYTHHTSEDTGDKVDPVELERAEVVGVASLLYLANLDEKEGTDLTWLALANASERLGQAGRKAYRYIASADESDYHEKWFEAQNTLDHEYEWCSSAVQSILHFNDAKAIESTVQMAVNQLGNQYKSISEGIRDQLKAKGFKTGNEPQNKVKPDTRIPVRLTRGPLPGGFPQDKLNPADASWYTGPGRNLSGTARFEIVNFINGKRTVTEIRDAVSAEFNPVPTEIVAHYINDLVKAGAAEWKK